MARYDGHDWTELMWLLGLPDFEGDSVEDDMAATALLSEYLLDNMDCLGEVEQFMEALARQEEQHGSAGPLYRGWLAIKNPRVKMEWFCDMLLTGRLWT